MTGLKIEDINFSESALIDRPGHAAVLGRIFTSWSLIEGTIAAILGLMLRADTRAAVAILSTFNTNSNRVNAVKKVAGEMLPESIRSDFDSIMNEVLNYAKERNKIAHNLWGAQESDPSVIYRMPMATYSNFVLAVPKMTDINIEEIVESFRSKMTKFSVSDLEKIEQRGHDVFIKVMKQMVKINHEIALENNSPHLT